MSWQNDLTELLIERCPELTDVQHIKLAKAITALVLGAIPEKKQPLRGIDVAIENKASEPYRRGFNEAVDKLRSKLKESE